MHGGFEQAANLPGRNQRFNRKPWKWTTPKLTLKDSSKNISAIIAFL